MKRWIYVLISICIIAAIIIVAIVLPKENNPPTQPIKEEIQIDCDDITMYLDDEPTKLNYTITNNQNLTISKSIYADNDNISILNGYVYANKVGESNITIKVSTENNIFTKTVKVKVVLTQCKIELNVTKQNAITDKLFVGESYVLEVSTSKKLNYEYQVFTSENIADLELIQNEENLYKFRFEVIDTDETKFIFKYKGLEESISLLTYRFVTDINVKFDNVLQNNVYLCLFNNNYKEHANQNNLYDSCSFEIVEAANCINNYSVKVSNSEVVKIQDNSIIAINEGVCDLIISALDGSNFTKSFKVFVSTSKIESLSFGLQSVDINIDEEYVINTTFNPVYAICNIEYFLNDQKLSCSKISFAEAGVYTIIAKDACSNTTASLTINVIQKLEYVFELVFLESFVQEYNATFEDNVLTMHSQNEQNQIYFSIKIE
ncbi:MAG: hypothetical protein J6Q51_04795, partial [Clostridia bacterium]|nr:hypothetical protein [Clostridia bacterium]